MLFRTSLDGFTKIVTALVILLLVLVVATQWFYIKNLDDTTAYFISFFICSIAVITYLFRPLYYTVTDKELLIKRTISEVKISRNNIAEVRRLSQSDLGLVLRVFGVGGLFGYFGKFASTKLGSMTWYATRRDKTVLIRTLDDKKIILTPDEPEKFVEELSQ